jgi:L-fuculose-phosphate aldolase
VGADAAQILCGQPGDLSGEAFHQAGALAGSGGVGDETRQEASAPRSDRQPEADQTQAGENRSTAGEPRAQTQTCPRLRTARSPLVDGYRIHEHEPCDPLRKADGEGARDEAAEGMGDHDHRPGDACGVEHGGKFIRKLVEAAGRRCRLAPSQSGAVIAQNARHGREPRRDQRPTQAGGRKPRFEHGRGPAGALPLDTAAARTRVFRRRFRRGGIAHMETGTGDLQHPAGRRIPAAVAGGGDGLPCHAQGDSGAGQAGQNRETPKECAAAPHATVYRHVPAAAVGMIRAMDEASRREVVKILRRAIEECRERFAPGCGEGGTAPEEIFRSAEALLLKQEIARTGQKLWQRAYVDGNGGNLSARIGTEWVLCTPTMVSKGDLDAEDMVLLDLENEQVCGMREKSSEVKLHLEIYKAQPRARAVVHCHPPYATAHAVAGAPPRGNLLPEQVFFIGEPAVAPYETPGTQAFAETVLPFLTEHNAILLRNHGVVCWAETVTRAEWLVEVLETYCKVAAIAKSLVGAGDIPQDKVAELLAMREQARVPAQGLDVQAPAARPAVRRISMGQLADSLARQVTSYLEGDKEQRWR